MITTLPNGQRVLENDTHISQWARERGTIKCDPWLFSILQPVIAPVSVIWDIGAFIGDHTRFYLDEGKAVVAVEPNPEAFACLEHNFPEAIMFNMAASSHPGELRMNIAPNAGASSVSDNGEVTVVAGPLDHLQLPDPGFIKVDVEGWEMEALRGMAATIMRCKPIAFVEVNRGALARNGHDHLDIENFFRGFGYTRFSVIPAGTPRDAEQYDLLIES